MSTTPKDDESPLSGLTEPRRLALERAPIRTRESSVTRAGWRLEAEAGEGRGTITLVEADDRAWHRGDGIFLGWPQERLAAAYRALLPEDDGDRFELMQMG
jgi:hypothetical protein